MSNYLFKVTIFIIYLSFFIKITYPDECHSVLFNSEMERKFSFPGNFRNMKNDIVKYINENAKFTKRFEINFMKNKTENAYVQK